MRVLLHVAWSCVRKAFVFAALVFVALLALEFVFLSSVMVAER